MHISERIDGTVPELAEIREVVLREWSAAKRKQANEAFYEALRGRYTVTVVKPNTMTSSQTSTEETIAGRTR